MSNGLADASFFPTAKELSTGLRWFKDHPVLAAAAATAVSVITYLNATDALAPTESDAAHDDASDRSEDGGSGDNEEEVYYKRSSGGRRRRDADDEGGDGKLSAAVSWCDEHGGSLTQVFEHSVESDEEPARLLNSNDSSQSTAERRAAADGGRSDDARPVGAAAAIRKSSTQQSIASGVDALDVTAADASHRLQALRDDESHAGGEGDLQTESPQWGWYVAITPPQDHASLPRVALLPPPRAQTIYAGGIARTNRVSVAPAPAPTLRRSASGRIP